MKVIVYMKNGVPQRERFGIYQRLAVEDPCCQMMKDKGLPQIEDGDGCVPHYGPDRIVSWTAAIDGTYAFDGMIYCPWCGTRLPTEAEERKAR